MKSVKITTDGACHPNPGKGGWAAILRFGTSFREIAGNSMDTTNNRMEFRAMIEALRCLKEPCQVIIRSDSETALAWCRYDTPKQLRRARKTPGLTEMLLEFRVVARHHEVTFEWIRGHNGDPDNERCDELAEDQARKPF